MQELTVLVHAAQTGDNDAFGHIVQRFQDMAYASAYAMLGDAHLAQDAAQEAFVDAFRSLGNLREPAAFPGWFRRIVVKYSDRQIRGKRVAMVPLDEVYDIRSPVPDPADMLEQALLQEDVHAAIQRLPLAQRQVTTLFYVEGYSQREIADYLEVPLTAVKKRLVNARKNLKERMVHMVQTQLQATKPSKDEQFANKVAFFIALKASDMGEIERLVARDKSLVHAVTEFGIESDAYYWPTGVTVLNYAAGTGNEPLVRLLLVNGADVNAQPKPHALTPLHEAINTHRPVTVQLLLQNGANVNARAYRAQTPLHYAIHKHSPTVATLLIKAGVDVNLADEEGWTPLDWAAIYKRTDLADLLTANGATRPPAAVIKSATKSSLPAVGRPIPVGTSVFGRVLNAEGQPLDGGPTLDDAPMAPIYGPVSTDASPILETGIKIIDLCAPLKRGGHNGLFTPLVGVGRLVVTAQLLYSMATLHDGCTVCIGLERGGYTANGMMHCWRDFGGDSRLMAERVVNVFGRIEDSMKQRLAVAETGLTMAEHFRRQGQDVLLLVDGELALSDGVLPYLSANVAATPEAAITVLYHGSYTVGLEPTPLTNLGSVMTFDRGRANQILYPAIDPLRSHSSLLQSDLVGADHVAVVKQMRKLFTRYAELHPSFDKYGADAFSHVDDPNVVTDALLARRLHRFLTQPLRGIEAFTGTPGVHVAVADAVRDCKAILAGEHGDLPEDAFYMVGTIADAVKKAALM